MTVALSAMAKPARLHVPAACPAKERWKIKTLSDPGVNQVRVNHWVNSTITKLRRNKPAVTITTNTPRLPTERTVYRVTAQLVEAKIEADGDVHLVIAAPGHPSLTMIAEFPKADCPPETTSPDVDQIDTARSAFEQLCGTQHGSWKRLHGLATIDGVGFFDVKHSGTGQTGHAPYNRELHPVIRFSTGSC